MFEYTENLQPAKPGRRITISNAELIQHRRNRKRGYYTNPERLEWARLGIQFVKRRGIKKNLPFDLDLNWLNELAEKTNFCPILGYPLIYARGRKHVQRDSPSIDRIDNNLGYTKDNVWIISHYANTLKKKEPLARILQKRGRVYTQAEVDDVLSVTCGSNQ